MRSYHRRQLTVCLVIHSSIVHYFSSEQVPVKHVVSHSDVLDLLANTRQPNNDCTPYAYRYLFGFDGYRGILRDYIEHGCQVNVIGEECFKSAFEQFIHTYELYDFQLTGKIDAAYPAALFKHDKGVIGWAPPILGSKKFQTVALASAPLTLGAVPKQIHISTLSHVNILANKSIERYFESEYVIAKPFCSSRSRMSDGSDYRVFHTSCWKEFSQELAGNPDWFEGVNGIILSEFIQTEDIFYDNRNAVVHKINLPSGFCDDDLGRWPLACDKFVGSVNLERARHAVQPFGYMLDEHEWVDGSLEHYRVILRNILNVLLPVPCLVSVDLMIRPSGQAAFLEVNKLAGTFDNASGTEQCALKRYMGFAVPYLLSKQDWSLKLEMYSASLLKVIPFLASLKTLPTSGSKLPG
jgi:hypothetical protein